VSQDASASTRAAVHRLVAAREDGNSLVANQALARLESALFGKPAATLTINRYPLIRKLGEGGSGLVYLAYDPRLDRKVAIKLLKSGGSPGQDDGEGRARLMREAQAMARSPHPNVIAVYDVDNYAGGDAGHAGVYLVMEYVEGPDLRRWLARRRHAWREILEVFLAAGRGLAAAHEVGVVHRDFKPANVIVGKDGRARVLDFGLARGTDRLAMETTLSSTDETEGLDSSLTVEGTVLGTPAFMAPEQHRGAPADARSDQFAFCVALWEGLYGKRPFEGSTPLELSRAKLDHRPRPPERTRVPGWIPRVLLRGLDPSPERRWPSMRALLDALSRGATRRRRRMQALVGGMALLVGGSAAAMWGGSPSPDPICTGSAARFETVWNAERRAAIERSFEATGLPYADDSFATVAARVDQLGVAWEGQHRDACEATSVRETQSSKVLDLRMACLDRQLRELDALLGVFETADAQVVERSARAVGGLTDPDACENVDALLAEVPPPRDPATAAAVEDLRQELTQVRALERVGRVAEGRALAQSLTERARPLGYRPLLAESLILQGQLAEKSGDYEDAIEAITQAHAAALASGDDRVAARAAKVMVFLIGARRTDLEEALRWADISAAELERNGDDEYDRAMLLNAESVAYRIGGRFDEARESGAEALELVERVAPEDPVLATMHTNFGEVLRWLGEYEEARRHQERALELYLAAVGPSHPDVAMAHKNLGNVYLEQDALADAEQEYRRAVEIRERAYGADHPEVATSLSNLGIVLRRQGKLEQARAVHERALSILEKRLGKDSPQLLGGVLNGLAQISREQGDLADAAAQLERALEVERAGLGPDHPELTFPLRNLGELYRELGRLPESIECYAHAEAILAAAPAGQEIRLGDTRYNLARSLRAAGREREAIAKAEQGLRELPEGVDAELRAGLEDLLAASLR
jgi:tetratricopeptide (TPR) repeat protein